MNFRRKDKLIYRIFIKIFVFFCILCFCYQSYGIVKDYFTYPTLIRIKTLKDSLIDFPAFTICLDFSEEDYVKNMTPLQFMTLTPNLTRENFRCFTEAIKLNNEKETYIERIACEDIQPVVISSGSVYSKCFTYFSQLQINTMAEKSTFRTDKYMTTRIILMSSGIEKFFNNESKGIDFSMHSPFYIPSAKYSDNIDLTKETDYRVYYWMNEMNLMEYPYETNCTHYGIKTKMKSASQMKCIQVIYFSK